MASAWFRVELYAGENDNEADCVLGRWYDLTFLPRVGDETIFDDSNDDCNCAKVVKVSHWMPHKSKDGNDDLDEQVSVVHLERVGCGTPAGENLGWHYDRDELLAAGFSIGNWHYGPE